VAKVIRRQIIALKPTAVYVQCHFCGTATRWEKRPELVYRGVHRYARWCCSQCGRTRERGTLYAHEVVQTRAALQDGPGSKAWIAYEKLETYV